LNAIDKLNSALPNIQSALRVENLAYAIAMNNNFAELFVAWKDDGPLVYHLKRVEGFLLFDREHVKKLHMQVQSIIKWGVNKRLDQVKNALDALYKTRTGDGAKSRPPPSPVAPKAKRVKTGDAQA
jgi:hypothetical protein